MPYLFLVISMLILSSCKGQNQRTDAGDVSVLNGFEIRDPTVPQDEIYVGTPQRDAIPAIDDPKYLSGKNADFMASEERIIGLKINNDIKAYPIRILTWHEIVNDVVGGKPVVISYCPLCHSAYVFERKINGKELTFGVSGLLYNSNVVMYDRQTESLWSQVKAEAISGKMKGTELEQVNATSTTWGDWIKENPETQVLSKNTGYDRNYEQSPYGGYSENREIMFPVQKTSDLYHPKTFVAGIEIDGKFKAYPFPELSKTDSEIIDDEFMGQELIIKFDEEAGEVQIKKKNGSSISVNKMYWFAWYAFHPETAVYQPV